MEDNTLGYMTYCRPFSQFGKPKLGNINIVNPKT